MGNRERERGVNEEGGERGSSEWGRGVVREGKRQGEGVVCERGRRRERGGMNVERRE